MSIIYVDQSQRANQYTTPTSTMDIVIKFENM